MRLGLLAVIGIVAGATLAAQEAALPAFEVASIKPGDLYAAHPPSSPDRFAMMSTTVKSLIAYGYDVRDFQIEGGPDWASSQTYMVNAKAPGAVGQPTMRLMVRRLLADRFGLRTHTESRDMPIYALVKARADGRLGERLQKADVDCAAILSQRSGAPLPPGDTSAPACQWRVGISPPVAMMFVDGAPIREFAGLLERLLGRRVVDETGLTGTFDIRLEFAADQLPVPLPPATEPPAPPRDGLSLLTAIEEQLGLRLESRRGPVPVIIIDAATPPTAD